MDIVWSSDAKADFLEGLVWLAERSQGAADRFERDVDLIVQHLARHPFMGRQTKIDGLRVMSLVKWQRRIAYQPMPDRIYIVSMKHTHQNTTP